MYGVLFKSGIVSPEFKEVVLGVSEKLPVPKVQLLLNNDVAEDRVYERVVCDIPTKSARSQELESKIGDCLPARVVTRL